MIFFFVLHLLITITQVSSMEVYKTVQSSSKHETIIQSVSAEAVQLLSAAGISGLCHPTSDAFEPYFPRCSRSLPHRMLADIIDEDESPNEDESSNEEEPVYEYKGGNIHSDWYYVRNALGALWCLVSAAVASGLTMGLVSLDPQLLRNKIRAATTSARERRQASKILPIVQRRHLLLVTLLLVNSVSNEALPIFLDAIFPTHLALLIAVIGVLFFGEIIPSAVFTGKWKIPIASRMLPLVRILLVVLWPIAYPISKLLDCVLTEDHDEDAHTSTYTPPTVELSSQTL